jgi:DNA modification methylase
MKNDHVVDWARAFVNARAPVLYVWFSFDKVDLARSAIESCGYTAKQQIIWLKNTVTPRQYQYLPTHETAILAIKEGATSKDIWIEKTREKTVWKIDSVAPCKRIHPTEKPLGVYTIPIANHTHEGDFVIDIFTGSGVLFAACHETNRIGLGVELCPVLCGRILERMETLGLEVKLERNVFD